MNLSKKQRDDGQAVMEYIMLLGAVIVPIALLIFYFMQQLENYYAIVSWMIALPFP